MVLLAVACAVLAGLVGLNLSFLGRTLPTGPFVVLALAVIFVAAYLFSPRYGIVARAVRRFHQAQKTASENGLKSVFLASPHDAPERGVSLEMLAQARREEPGATGRLVRALARRGWLRQEGNHVSLTEPRLIRARELERNYRLWEQFLTDEVQLPADHTQRDAENLEHILEPDLVRELEARFKERHG
jgi:manganese/zinc/iron transport system permease protein